jgi:hypothetical protein
MVPSPGAAQATAAERVAADPFERVLAAIERSVPDEAILESSVRGLETTWRQNPAMAALERQRPGILAVLSEAARPTLASWSARVRAEFRPRYVAALRSRLSVDEALDLADFYDSPIGHKLLVGIPGNYTGTAAATALAAGQSVTPQQVRQDASAAANATLASLTEAERTELAREAAAHPALLKLEPARAEFSRLRAQMEQTPLTAAETAMLNAALRSALGAR